MLTDKNAAATPTWATRRLALGASRELNNDCSRIKFGEVVCLFRVGPWRPPPMAKRMFRPTKKATRMSPTMMAAAKTKI